MINLIKNEFVKIFKRKNIYIMLAVVAGFILLTNILYKFAYSNEVYYDSYQYTEDYKYSLESELKNLDPNKPADLAYFIQLKSEIESIDLVKKFGNDSWQKIVIQNKISSTIYDYIASQYDKSYEIDPETAKIAYDNAVQRLNNNEWKPFLEDEKVSLEKNIKTLEAQLAATDKKSQKSELTQSIKMNKLELEIVETRINKDINYSNDYLNRNLEIYQGNKSELIYFDGQEKLKHDEKVHVQSLQEGAALAKYSVDNKQDVTAEDTSRGMLLNITSQYSLAILLVIIMIAGGIVSDEFSKGTIKLLLIKPYERRKILGAKLITTLLMIPLTIAAVLLLQFIFGSIFFGFESLSIPAVFYNFTTNSITTMSLVKGVLINIACYLPQLILLLMLAFAISTLFSSTALAVALTLVGSFAATLINQFVIYMNVNFMRFFPTLNWDFSEYLFGRLPSFEPVSFIFSIIICIAYFLIMAIPTFIVFKKKNIKNI